MYHHRDQMDSARYQELLAKDAELKARLEALEKEKVARDPNYVLPALAQNPDLQYSKDFVTAAYNPVPVATQTPTVSDGTVGKVFFWIFVILILVLAVGMVVYFVCIKEYPDSY